MVRARPATRPDLQAADGEGEQAGPADVGDRIHEFAVAGRPGRLGARRESNRADCDEQRTEDRANGAHHSRAPSRSEEHTSELQSLMRISSAVFCLKKKKQNEQTENRET